MTPSPAALIPLLLLLPYVGASAGVQCGGQAPMMPLVYKADYSTADKICCHNRHYAEHRGYASTVGFYDSLDSNKVHTFYDSVCGIPLFKAPVGRSFAEWRAESVNHGWPSFRPAETFQGGKEG